MEDESYKVLKAVEIEIDRENELHEDIKNQIDIDKASKECSMADEEFFEVDYKETETKVDDLKIRMKIKTM